MGFKVNMYSAKTTSSAYSLSLETLAIELAIGTIGAVSAIAGFKAQLWLVWIPSFLIAITCFSLVVYNIYHYIQDKRLAKKSDSNTD